jgi:hypothetical protein
MPQPANDTTVFHPQKAQYFDQIDAELHLTADELALLKRGGFCITDRLTFDRFRRAYAWIYWKDLPVLVTTDAILHAIHQTYDELLKQVETTLLTQKLIDMLSGARDYVRQTIDAAPESLKPIYADLDLYLTVPLVILTTDSRWILLPHSKAFPDDLAPEVSGWLAQIAQANSDRRFIEFDDSKKMVETPRTPVGVESLTLFGLERKIDFTQFRARGHYDKPEQLVAYFCAMMWIQLVDFRFVEYDEHGLPHLHRDQLIAAHLLRDAIDGSGQRKNADDIDRLLVAFVGWSDNLTLNGLDNFIAEAGIQLPLEYWESDERQLLTMLLRRKDAHQRIRGQVQKRASNLEGQLPHHIVFALMGQRYTIESDIFQQVVYDKLEVDGRTVERAYPSPLDAMAALGNARAWIHLGDEFAKYGYEQNLRDIQAWTATHSEEFWGSTFYNLWLRAIIALNADTTGEQYPRVMRSAAWGDKTLHTQLASWTQLRHDNILYAKPPYNPGAVCEYPAGYVEPYPDFYAALGNYARFGREVFSKLQLDAPGETLEEAEARLGDEAWKREDELRPHRAVHVREVALTYFDHLEASMSTLEGLARKELDGQAFSQEDELFLRSIMVRKYVGDTRYGGITEEHWDGWYNGLLPFGDDSCQLVADVYTNYNSRIGEVGVLHLGLSDPVMMIAQVDSGGEETLYVGPVFTLCEHLETANPPHRLTDEEWQDFLYRQSPHYRSFLQENMQQYQTELENLERISELSEKQQKDTARLKSWIREYEVKLSQIKPKSPLYWTSGFRQPSQQTESLNLPDAYQDFKAALSKRLQLYLDAIRLVAFEEGISLRIRGYGMDMIAKFVATSPERLHQIEGVDQSLLDELTLILYEKGYLQ